MVYIFIESLTNPINVQIDPIIENPKFIHLESFTMYNSWDNLVEGSAIILKESGNNVLLIPSSHYTKETLKNKINFLLQPQAGEFNVKIENNKFILTLTEDTKMNTGLKNLLTGVDGFSRPDVLDLRCSIIESCITIPKKNIDILTRIEVQGKPYERQIYNFENCVREIASNRYLNSFQLSVTDIDGNLIDFRGHKLRFTINII